VKYPVCLVVNGREVRREVDARTLLVDFLREELGLTGTHVGCDASVCGACTVLLDGMAVKSCTYLAVQADGRSVTTLEGLAAAARRQGTATSGGRHPVQEALAAGRALGCGFCAPGRVLSLAQAQEAVGRPSRKALEAALAGALCRCLAPQASTEALRRGPGGSGGDSQRPRDSQRPGGGSQ